MDMIYRTEEGREIHYTLATDPPEAQMWSTYKLKKTQIKVLSKLDPEEKTMIRDLIFEDICRTEGNPVGKFVAKRAR